MKFCRRTDRKFDEEQRKAMTGEEHNLRIYDGHSADDSYQKTLTLYKTSNISNLRKNWNNKNERDEKDTEKPSSLKGSYVKSTKKGKAHHHWSCII